MALKLSLKPGEKIAINGAVVVNGDRRAEIAVENPANILRERDIMAVDEANSPARRIYFSVMIMALGEGDLTAARAEFERRIMEFAAVVETPAALALCAKISANVANGERYKALAHCKSLIAFETERLYNAA